MKRLLAYSLVIGIFAVLVVHLRRHADVLGAVEWAHRPGLLLLHVALLACMFACFVVGWRRAAKTSGVVLPWCAAAATWLVPNLGKYVPGKVLMFAGRVELTRRAGGRRSAGLSALVFEHVAMLLAAMPFLVWAAARGLDLSARPAVLSVAAITVAGLLLCARPRLLIRVLNRVLAWRGRPTLDAMPRPRDMVGLLGVYLVTWLLYGASGAVLARALGLAGAAPYGVLMTAFVAAWVLGFLSVVTPGGLGVRELVLVVLLAPWVASAEATTLALLARLSWTAVELAGAAWGVLLAKSLPSDPSTGERVNVETPA